MCGKLHLYIAVYFKTMYMFSFIWSKEKLLHWCINATRPQIKTILIIWRTASQKLCHTLQNVVNTCTCTCIMKVCSVIKHMVDGCIFGHFYHLYEISINMWHIMSTKLDTLTAECCFTGFRQCTTDLAQVDLVQHPLFAKSCNCDVTVFSSLEKSFINVATCGF